MTKTIIIVLLLILIVLVAGMIRQFLREHPEVLHQEDGSIWRKMLL